MARSLEQQNPSPKPTTTSTSSTSTSTMPGKTWRKTPLIESSALSAAAGCRIFLKLENIQPSGSFKSRGIGNYIEAHHQRAGGSPLHFYSSSGGNAGLAAVIAAGTLGQPCTVVVPQTTKPEMIAKIRAVGATDVIQRGASWFDADAYLREVCLKNDPRGVYVPPFDHPLIWEGAAGMIPEIKEQMAEVGEPDAVVCSVGGGGLFCGIAQGVEREYASRPQIIAVETVGCDSLNLALKAGELVTLPKITSLATSLGCVRVAEQAFEYAKQKNVKSITVTDAEAALGCWRFADDQRVLTELSCGAALTLAYIGRLPKLVPNFSRESKVVLVVCGGSNVSLQMLADYREVFGEEAERSVARNGDVPSSFTAPS